MQIRNGRLAGARFVAANSSGGPITPELIVLHDTAGRLEKGSSVAWFRSKQCQTSAHFVVERDGDIVQMVPTDRRAFHAGVSQWRGRTYCNSFAIGIEIVSPGECAADGRAWFHKKSEPGFALSELVHRPSPRTHGSGPARWMPYTPAQIDAVKRLCRALMEHYPGCNDIVTHWMIAPGRKVDTSPLLPLDEITAYACGQDTADEAAPPPAAAGLVQPPAPASALQTSTGVNATVIGTGGTSTTGVAVATAARSNYSPEGFDWLGFGLTLAADPMFWIGVATVVSALVVYRERIKKLWRGI